MLALAVACSSSVSVAFVLFISLFMFQWWFLKELSFVLAAECDMVPAARPPPAWGSASVWTILLHQLCHLLSSCQPTCLLWWFIKGCHSASAAEPRISTKPRPPPACCICRSLYATRLIQMDKLVYTYIYRKVYKTQNKTLQINFLIIILRTTNLCNST